TLGGPIRRNQLFFFGSYEGYISRLEEFLFFDVPDAALRRGDFNRAVNADGSLQRIYDPLSGDLTTGTGRTPFPDDTIPGDRMHPMVQELVALYPEPNVEGTGAGGLTSNYRTTQRVATDRHNFDLKINWNRTSAHQIWGKVSHMTALVDDLFTFPIGSAEDDGGDTKVYQVTVGQTWTLSPTLLLDSSLGVSLNDQFVSSPDFGLGMLGLELGIPGTNDQGAGDPRYAGMPQLSTGFTPLGSTPAWSPIYRDEGSQSFTTNITKVAGRHEVKAGYFLNHLTLDDWQPSRANPRGQFVFASNATRAFGTGSQTANFYNTYAAFLLGLVDSAVKGLQYENFTANEWQHALYVRDRWTVTPKLTLDLGLRWEYYPIMRRANRQIEMLDLNTLDVLIGGVGGNPENMGLVAPKDAFAPRIGVVYRLNDKTVVRSGYGLTYDAQGMSGELAFYGYQSYPLVLNSDHRTPAERATFGWYGTLDQGIPLLVPPDVSDGRVPLPNTIGMHTAVPDSTDRGKTHSWNVAIERRLPLDLSLDVAYVSNRVRGGLTPININNAQTLGGGGLDRPYLLSHERQLPITIFTPYAKTDYDALQVGITRPFTDGLLLKGHYTYSSSWSRGTSASGSVYGAGRQYELPTPEAQARNWMPAGGSRPHTFTMAFVYQLPWQSSGIRQNPVKTLISDWQVNGVFMAFAGTPFTITADGTDLDTPGNLQTADLVGPVTEVGEIGADGVYYDPSAWAQPEGVRFGNTGPNQFRGPGGWNLDLSVFRTFPLGGPHRLEARIEATNVTDTPKFGSPDGDITSGDFMRIFSLHNAFSERQIRLALRYSF
ncbi:MAG: TonB-dependent receptor, partial [Vicinamibacteraceae bacterium]